MTVPANDKSFNAYYNKFSVLVTKFATLSQASAVYNTSTICINMTNLEEISMVEKKVVVIDHSSQNKILN